MKNKELREKIIEKYFKSWIINDSSELDIIFSEDITYTECYGPQYNNLEQIKKWFSDWHNNGNVSAWDIKQFVHENDMVVVEWFFKCTYKNEHSAFDGVSLIKFTENNKIINLKEFESKAEHYYPYK